jgi:adenine-specific DNA methylase
LYGIETWQELFNDRQKLGIITFLDKLRLCAGQIKADCACLVDALPSARTPDKEQLGIAVMGYLAIILDRCIDKGSVLARWHNSGEKIEATFSRQALPMTWDFVEINFFSGINGDWTANRDWVLRFIRANPAVQPRVAPALGELVQRPICTVLNASATDLPLPDNAFDAVFTDPPYYDNVYYADLSDFYYVWLKRTLSDELPGLFARPLVPKADEAVMQVSRQGGAEQAKVFFERTLAASFQEIRRVLKPGGIAIIVYAHKKMDGWETMLNGLVQAGLVVTASWPIHTEMRTRLLAAGTTALASSIYFVCRKTEREQVGSWHWLRPRIKARVEHKLAQFLSQGIAGSDLLFSAIGPGVAEYSRYEQVKNDLDQTVSVGELLAFIRQTATSFARAAESAKKGGENDRI